MCGIVGILKPAPAGELKSLAESLIPYIDHRGPDEYGSYGAPGIGLGHSRLSIIDLAGGHQPMISDRSVLVYNGEVYNYIELKAELQNLGARFETTSDTEVVQRAIEWWGPDAFRRFNGQFALLFWDKKQQKLLAARDRYGIRPLYYYPASSGAVYFSSELRVFDHIGEGRRQWSPENLLEHGLLWNTLGGNTVFKGIFSLEGGHYQYFTHNGTSGPEAYYTLGEESGPETSLCLPDQVALFRQKLEESVKLRLRSDVPVGCYLSGGLDSSVTSYLAKKINNHRFKSFSVAFTDTGFDESEFQQMMVNSIDSDHYSVTVDGTDIAENFVDAAGHFERPIFRTAPVPLYMLSKKVREQDIKVVLTGEAADEILFGYDTYKELKLLSSWKNGLSDTAVMSILGQLYPHLDHYRDAEQLGFLKMYYEGFLDRFSGPLAGLAMRVSNNQVLTKMFNRDWGLEFNFDTLADKIEALTPVHVKEWSILKRNQYWEMKTLLSGYLLSAQGDRMAMAHSVEGRFPFLDHTLIEWVLTLPDETKLNGYSAKDLLKQAFKKELPEPILNRPKRPYMAPDLASFFPQGKRGDLVKSFLNSDIIDEYGLYDRKMVERLLFKIERRGLTSAGYRDNMLISFILSNQILESRIRNPESRTIDRRKQKISVTEA